MDTKKKIIQEKEALRNDLEEVIVREYHGSAMIYLPLHNLALIV